jgi:hypothetical protein
VSRDGFSYIGLLEGRFDTLYMRDAVQHYNGSLDTSLEDIVAWQHFLKIQTHVQWSLPVLVFQAMNYPIKEHRQRNYVVHVYLPKEEYCCVCCKFEKYGMLWSHILKVMIHINIEKILDKYIMDRWRKRDKKLLPNLLPEKVADNDTLGYNVLSIKSVKT